MEREVFPKYLVKHGIDHLFELEDTDGVRNRLLDLQFFNELDGAIEWTEILKYWRTLGEEEDAGQSYLKAVDKALSGQVDDTLLEAVSSVGIFCNDCYWLDAGLEITKKCLESKELLLGAEHPDTLDSVGSLGILIKNMGNYKEAEKYYRRALESREKVLGTEHPTHLLV